jgi:NADH dehydrogenase
MRGVDTVIHLASSPRDQAAGSIEELNGVATWRMVGAAQRAGVERFIFLSTLGATTHSRTRLHRAKALAERVVLGSGLRTTVLAPSLVYAPGDRWLTALGRFALLPAMPMPGRGRALFQPIWAEDVADCVMAVLHGAPGGRYELAGPQTLSHEDIVRVALRSFGRSRPLLHVPTAIVSRVLRLMEAALQSKSPAVWDEAELLEVSMLTPRGTADVTELGVAPRSMGEVLGAA